MSKKERTAAPKSAKINPESDAPQSIPSPASDAPQAQKPKADAPKVSPNPADDKRAELVKKAQAAKQAAMVGLIPKEQAEAIWNEAVEACKPSEESIAMAKTAKAIKDESEKVFNQFANGAGVFRSRWSLLAWHHVCKPIVNTL